jgi:hypothetical protein
MYTHRWNTSNRKNVGFTGVPRISSFFLVINTVITIIEDKVSAYRWLFIG